MDTSESILAVTSGLAAIMAYAWLRGRARYTNERSTEQLNNAALFLNSHTEALERFLADPDAPNHMKNILLNSSDAMDNQAEVRSLVEAMAYTPLGELSEEYSAETGALRADLDDLERHNPDLAKAFETAVRTGAFAAILRWPETACLFERVVTRVESERDRDLQIAVATVGHHERFESALSTSVAAA